MDKSSNTTTLGQMAECSSDTMTGSVLKSRVAFVFLLDQFLTGQMLNGGVDERTRPSNDPIEMIDLCQSLSACSWLPLPFISCQRCCRVPTLMRIFLWMSVEDSSSVTKLLLVAGWVCQPVLGYSVSPQLDGPFVTAPSCSRCWWFVSFFKFLLAGQLKFCWSEQLLVWHRPEPQPGPRAAGCPH